MTIETIFNAIRDKVDTDLPSLVPVYDGDIWDDATLPTVSGIVKPFVVFYAGTSETTKDPRARGIIGPASDPISYDVMFEAVGATSAIARTVFGQVRDILLGWAPSGSTMLKLDSVRGYDIGKTETRPIVYCMAGLFDGIGNL